MSTKRGRYSPEFREAAVREVIDKSRAEGVGTDERAPTCCGGSGRKHV
jgi:hypothetical protein